MTPYANLDGGTSIVAYELGDDDIVLRFKGGEHYQYNYSVTGQTNVEAMKKLAIEGRGLNSYIWKHHIKHAEKW